MELLVRCSNYEGAHFRGIKSDTDETLCILPIKGEETKICTFLLNNCSYGQNSDKPINTINDLCVLLKHDSIPVFDGCGAILVIEQDGKALVDIRDEYDFTEPSSLTDSVEWLTLPMVDVDLLSEKELDSINYLNNLVVENK